MVCGMIRTDIIKSLLLVLNERFCLFQELMWQTAIALPQQPYYSLSLCLLSAAEWFSKSHQITQHQIVPCQTHLYSYCSDLLPLISERPCSICFLIHAREVNASGQNKKLPKASPELEDTQKDGEKFWDVEWEGSRLKLRNSRKPRIPVQSAILPGKTAFNVHTCRETLICIKCIFNNSLVT